MVNRGEVASVLVTVKATPQPSRSYGDTVCVAGLRIDTDPPSWIRLYPIPFRWLEPGSRFKKYSIVKVPVTRRVADTRRESYSPDVMSLEHSDPLPNWRQRHEYVGRAEPTTTCALVRAAKADGAAPSLGLVYPTDVSRVSFESHEPWTDSQVQAMRSRAEAESASLFGGATSVPRALIAPRFRVTYHYRCAAAGCGGHVGRNLDWELTAFQNRSADVSDTELKSRIEDRFLSSMFAHDRSSGFFLGNFEAPAKRGGFSVLGVYYPPMQDAVLPPQTLF